MYIPRPSPSLSDSQCGKQYSHMIVTWSLKDNDARVASHHPDWNSCCGRLTQEANNMQVHVRTTAFYMLSCGVFSVRVACVSLHTEYYVVGLWKALFQFQAGKDEYMD